MPVISFAVQFSGNVRYHSDKRGEFLQFNNCAVTSSRFGYLKAGHAVGPGDSSANLTVSLFVKPDIQILFA